LQRKAAKKNNGVFEHQRRRSDAQTNRNTGSSPPYMPSIIGACIIGACILLSTLISAVSNRYVGFEGPSDETAWLVDRLTGTVYRCHAAEQGKASCDERGTGSPGQPR
jgi:hypothetical protein